MQFKYRNCTSNSNILCACSTSVSFTFNNNHYPQILQLHYTKSYITQFTWGFILSRNMLFCIVNNRAFIEAVSLFIWWNGAISKFTYCIWMCQKTSQEHCAIGVESTVLSVVQIKAMADGERWKGLWCRTQACWYQSAEIILIHAPVEAPIGMFSWSPACTSRDRAGCPNVALI